MVSVSTTVAASAAASVLFLALSSPVANAAEDICWKLTNGEACTNKADQPSRCSPLYGCRDLPAPCKPGQKELAVCGNGYTEFCFAWTNPGTLSCINKLEIVANLRYEACRGKPDGAPCVAAYFEGDYHDTAAVYEERGGSCQKQQCLSPASVVCENKPNGTPCSFEGVLGGKRQRFGGLCEDGTKYLHPVCKFKSYEEIGPATPIKSHNAPAPTTTSPPTTSSPPATTTPPPVTTTTSPTEAPTSTKPRGVAETSAPPTATNSSSTSREAELLTPTTTAPFATLAPTRRPSVTTARQTATTSSSADAAAIVWLFPTMVVTVLAGFVDL